MIVNCSIKAVLMLISNAVFEAVKFRNPKPSEYLICKQGLYFLQMFSGKARRGRIINLSFLQRMREFSQNGGVEGKRSAGAWWENIARSSLLYCL